jgi:hypothetical protein
VDDVGEALGRHEHLEAAIVLLQERTDAEHERGVADALGRREPIDIHLVETEEGHAL